MLSRRLTATTVGGQTLTSTWDALGRQTAETGPLGTIASEYDLAGRRTRMTWPGGGYSNYTWNLDNGLQSLTWGPSFSALAAYVYDDLGRRTAITRANGVTTSYGYNTASQLTSLSHDLAGSAQDVTYGFSYTPAPQIASRTVNNALYDYTPTSGTTAYTNNGLNQSTVAGGASVTWSAQGNLTSDSVRSYTYDAANRLLTGGGSTLTYDPLDRLYSMTGTGAGWFQYDGSQLAAVYDGSGTLVGRYFAGSSPDEWALWEDGTVNVWPLQDAQGSVIALTNSSGVATSILAYDEYGQPRSGNAGRMQYTGQMVLPDAGLCHYKARSYHAGLGRFVQTDPIGYEQGLNLYSYTDNDPVNNDDPDGEQPRNTALPQAPPPRVYRTPSGQVYIHRPPPSAGIRPSALGGRQVGEVVNGRRIGGQGTAFFSGTSVSPAPNSRANAMREPLRRNSYPPNGGALTFTEREVTFRPGQELSRFGNEGGRYMSPGGTPWSARGLPTGPQIERRYEVLRPFNAQGSVALPAFQSPGGGVQYRLSEPVSYYTSGPNPYLREITTR